MDSNHCGAPDTTSTSIVCNKVFIDGPAIQYVKLNVGGSLFQTTLGTLCKYDCMLRAMFSGRMEVLRDLDGYVLIDRCGKHFGLILNFLRQGSCSLPECQMEMDEILYEAKYYLIQELINHCMNWLQFLNKVQSEPSDCIRVPVVVSKTDVERILHSCTDRPVIELLINRQNNKYSYTLQADENFLRNQELFDKLLLRFNNRVLFIKNVGIGSSEMCQWTFYGNGQKKIEICCTSIVYATDKKQTKVEFPEARIYEEAMNSLLTYTQESSKVCPRCRSVEDSPVNEGSRAKEITSSFVLEPICSALRQDLAAEHLNAVKANFSKLDWKMNQLAVGTSGHAMMTSHDFSSHNASSSLNSSFHGRAHHHYPSGLDMAAGPSRQRSSDRVCSESASSNHQQEE